MVAAAKPKREKSGAFGVDGADFSRAVRRSRSETAQKHMDTGRAGEKYGVFLVHMFLNKIKILFNLGGAKSIYMWQPSETIHNVFRQF